MFLGWSTIVYGKVEYAGNGEVEAGADMNEDDKVDATDLATLKLYLATN